MSMFGFDMESESESESDDEQRQSQMSMFGADVEEMWLRGKRGGKKALAACNPTGLTLGSVLPTHVQTPLTNAQFAYVEEDYDRAISLFEEVICKAPKLPNPHTTMGMIYEGPLNDKTKALHHYTEAARLSKRGAGPHHRKVVELAYGMDLIPETQKALHWLVNNDPDVDAFSLKAILQARASAFMLARNTLLKMLRDLPEERNAIAGLLPCADVCRRKGDAMGNKVALQLYLHYVIAVTGSTAAPETAVVLAEMEETNIMPPKDLNDLDTKGLTHASKFAVSILLEGSEEQTTLGLSTALELLTSVIDYVERMAVSAGPDALNRPYVAVEIALLYGLCRMRSATGGADEMQGIKAVCSAMDTVEFEDVQVKEFYDQILAKRCEKEGKDGGEEGEEEEEEEEEEQEEQEGNEKDWKDGMSSADPLDEETNAEASQCLFLLQLRLLVTEELLRLSKVTIATRYLRSLQLHNVEMSYLGVQGRPQVLAMPDRDVFVGVLQTPQRMQLWRKLADTGFTFRLDWSLVVAAYWEITVMDADDAHALYHAFIISREHFPEQVTNIAQLLGYHIDRLVEGVCRGGHADGDGDEEEDTRVDEALMNKPITNDQVAMELKTVLEHAVHIVDDDGGPQGVALFCSVALPLLEAWCELGPRPCVRVETSMQKMHTRAQTILFVQKTFLNAHQNSMWQTVRVLCSYLDLSWCLDGTASRGELLHYLALNVDKCRPAGLRKAVVNFLHLAKMRGFEASGDVALPPLAKMDSARFQVIDEYFHRDTRLLLTGVEDKNLPWPDCRNTPIKEVPEHVPCPYIRTGRKAGRKKRNSTPLIGGPLMKKPREAPMSLTEAATTVIAPPSSSSSSSSVAAAAAAAAAPVVAAAAGATVYLVAESESARAGAAPPALEEGTAAAAELQQSVNSIAAANTLCKSFLTQSELRPPNSMSMQGVLPLPLLRAQRDHPDSVPFTLMLAHAENARRKHLDSIRLYLNAFVMAPDQPLVSLCLAKQLVFFCRHMQVANRHETFGKAMAMMVRYQRDRLRAFDASEHRRASVPRVAGEGRLSRPGIMQELMFNLARAMEDTGLNALACELYEKTLTLSTDLGLDPEVNLTREAAHNLALVYHRSGADALAAQIRRKYLSF